MTNETRKFTPPKEGEVREYVTRNGRGARAYVWGDLVLGDVDGKPVWWSKEGANLVSGRNLFDKPKHTITITEGQFDE